MGIGGPTPRLHLMEIEDQPWCPPAVRRGGTRYLHFVGNLARAPYLPFCGALAHAMRHTGDRELLDLCSGSAGPLPTLLDVLAEQGISATVRLTDLFPDVGAFEAAAATDRRRIVYEADPVDATEVPPGLGGFRVLCCAFHHFAPEAARRILADAVRRRRGIAVLEIVERRPASLLASALGLVGVPLTFPFIRPFRWKLAALVYLLPLIPAMTAFDGVVSALRVYSVGELQRMVAEVDPDDTFSWCIERTTFWGLPMGITWLVGHPR